MNAWLGTDEVVDRRMQDDGERRTRRRRLSHRFQSVLARASEEQPWTAACLCRLFFLPVASLRSTTCALSLFLAQPRSPLASGTRFPVDVSLSELCFDAAIRLSSPRLCPPPRFTQPHIYGASESSSSVVCPLPASSSFSPPLTHPRAQGSRCTRSRRRPRAETRHSSRSSFRSSEKHNILDAICFVLGRPNMTNVSRGRSLHPLPRLDPARADPRSPQMCAEPAGCPLQAAFWPASPSVSHPHQRRHGPRRELARHVDHEQKAVTRGACFLSSLLFPSSLLFSMKDADARADIHFSDKFSPERRRRDRRTRPPTPSRRTS
jgi:hypothetical protein